MYECECFFGGLLSVCELCSKCRMREVARDTESDHWQKHTHSRPSNAFTLRAHRDMVGEWSNCVKCCVFAHY